jgi:hypothetical protein
MGCLTIDAADDTDLERVFANISEVVNQAVAGFLTQNIQSVEISALTANALYAQWKGRGTADEQLALFILRQAAILYAPLTRGMVFQVEGRFSDARAEMAKGLAICNDAFSVVEEYAQLPNADKDLTELYGPLFSILPIFFRGMDAYVQADLVGYQGNIRKYRELLFSAISTYHRASSLPPSVNPESGANFKPSCRKSSGLMQSCSKTSRQRARL